MHSFVSRQAVALLFGAGGLALASSSLAAQGCEPIRFTAPVNLGGEGQAYQPGHEWRMTLAYRRLHSNEWFIGSEESGTKAPGGSPPIFNIHTAVVDVAYAFNDRVRARLSVPISDGSFARTWSDGKRHEQTARGIGDISVQGETWLFEPRTHSNGNVSLGLGLKAPTGSHTKASTFYLGSGPVAFPADQTIQPGDGGWAILSQLQAFRQLGDRTTVYGFGSYMVSPKDRTEVRGAPVPAPNSGLYWSVPDVYSVRSGAVLNVLPDQGLSMSLGARLDGIPVHDLIGGGDDDTIKRTSRIYYAEPGLSYARGKDIVTLSVPWRLKVNRLKSLAEQKPGALPNAGGFAKYLLFFSYSRRL